MVDHGAEYLFGKEWFDRLDPSEYSAAYICGLEIEERTGSTIVDFLERSGLPVFFAPGPRLAKIDPALMDRIFALHPVLHLNREEICSYTGCPEVEDAAKALFAQTKNSIIITQGYNRQIRRMCEALGNKVVFLKRVRIMNILLGDLPEGKYRLVEGRELEALEALLKPEG